MGTDEILYNFSLMCLDANLVDENTPYDFSSLLGQFQWYMRRAYPSIIDGLLPDCAFSV